MSEHSPELPSETSEPHRQTESGETDIQGQYLKEIGRTALLTAAEEVEIAKRIEAGLYAEKLLAGEAQQEGAAATHEELSWLVEDGVRAFDHMYHANLRLVVSIAKKYRIHNTSSYTQLDMISEGNVGLRHAVEMFDFTKGYKFSTYATWWIRQAITRANADQARTIRLPVHVVERLNKFNKKVADLRNTLKIEPSDDEILEHLRMTPTELAELRQLARLPLSFQMVIGDDDYQLQDRTPDKARSPDDEAIDKLVKQEIVRIIDHVLDDRTADIIKRRYGFTTGEVMTLDEIAKIYGLTRERIRQLEKQGKDRLRPHLAPLLDR